MATHQHRHIKKHVTNTKYLITRNESLGERYADVVRPTGDCRFECRFLDNSTTIAVLCGRLTKGPHRQRIAPGDFVLLQTIECHTEKNKYYIINKYSADEKKKLSKNGELTQIKTTEDIGTTVMMESEIIMNKKVAELGIDDDFIDNI